MDEASSKRQSDWFMVRTEMSSQKPGNAEGATTDCKKTDCLPEGSRGRCGRGEGGGRAEVELGRRLVKAKQSASFVGFSPPCACRAGIASACWARPPPAMLYGAGDDVANLPLLREHPVLLPFPPRRPGSRPFPAAARGARGDRSFWRCWM